MSVITEIRHGTAKPASLRRSHIFIQHDPDSNKIFGIWAGNKNDNRRCVQPLKVSFPGDGNNYQVLPEDRHVGMDTTTSIATATLPSPDDINDGHLVAIEDHGGNATSNNITIATPGSETVETSTISANDGLVKLMWDAANTNWKDVS